MSLTPDLFGLSISRTECRPACHLDLRSYPVPRPASLPTRNAIGLKVLLSPARLEQFSITLTQLLCHAPRRRGIQYAPECSGNTARPVVTGSSAFADDDIMWYANVIEKRSKRAHFGLVRRRVARSSRPRAGKLGDRCGESVEREAHVLRRMGE